MKQVFSDVKTGDILVMEVPKPSCKNEGILVETIYSLVSAGTERSLIDFGKKNLILKAKERPDQVKKVIDKMKTDGVITAVKAAFNKLDEPLPLGYSGVGKVIEVGKGCIEFKVGDLVAIAGTLHANHAEINYVPKNLAVKLPSDFENIEEASFVALGAVAMQGIRQAEVELGEKVAVIGLGLLGQIACQILHAYGNEVIGIDINDEQYNIGKEYIDHFVNSSEDDAVSKVMNITNGYGVDKILITAATTSNQPIEFSAEIARDRAIISMVGVTGMEIPRRSFYEKELTFKLSRSYGPGRYDETYEEKSIDYPIGYVRWTEKRIMEEFIRLIYTKRINMKKLITHNFEIGKAPEAYKMITENPNKEKYLGVIFSYPNNEKKNKNIIVKSKVKSQDKIGIGLIGSGNFARSTILPNLTKIDDFELVGLSTSGSTSAGQTIKKYNFKYSTTDYKKLLEDKDIDLIIISTPHNTHAKFAIEALDAGKHVYIEKPLAINMEQLEKVKEAYERNTQHLIVGFNRRFSPFAKWIKEQLQTDKFTTLIQYTINAGEIPKDHWINDPTVGGGRIIGEVCHFVDFCQYLTDSKIKNASTFSINGNSEKYINNDNISMNIEFANGSLANIIYTSMGPKSYPKENVRVFTNGNVAELKNFVKAEIYTGGRKIKKSKLQQDKGFIDEYEYIRDIIKGKRENDYLTFEEIYETTKILF